jgi:hypothetical protein
MGKTKYAHISLRTDKEERRTRRNDGQGGTMKKEERRRRRNDEEGGTTKKEERRRRRNDEEGGTTKKEERRTRRNDGQGGQGGTTNKEDKEERRTRRNDEEGGTTNNKVYNFNPAAASLSGSGLSVDTSTTLRCGSASHLPEEWVSYR